MDFTTIFLPKFLPSSPKIVQNTPKMTPSNFLKKSLNSLFIDPGVSGYIYTAVSHLP